MSDESNVDIMMADKTWKAYERRVAASISGWRNPITGRARGDVPDVENEEVVVEVKFRTVPLPKYMLDALDQAEKSVEKPERSKKKPFVRWHTKGEHHGEDVCLIRWRHLEEIAGWGKWGE